MLLSKEVEVTINSSNFNHYLKKGYEFPMKLNSHKKPTAIEGSKIIVKVEDLPITSGIEIKCTCDFCGKEMTKSWGNYQNQLNKANGILKCHSCAASLHRNEAKLIMKAQAQFPELLVEENDFIIQSLGDLYVKLGIAKSHWARWLKKNVYNNKQFIREIDWKPYFIEINGNETIDFMINEGFAIHLINSAKHIDSKTKIETMQYFNLNKDYIDVYSRNEISFLEILEKQLSVFGIIGIKQYKILSYRIDYYIPSLNIAIEYDEDNHKHYTYEEHEGRQKRIEEELGCKFIRVTDELDDITNSALVLKEILNK